MICFSVASLIFLRHVFTHLSNTREDMGKLPEGQLLGVDPADKCFFCKVVIFITFCCLHYPFLMQKLKKKMPCLIGFINRIYLCIFIFSHIKMKSLDGLYEIITAAKTVCIAAAPRPPPLLLLLLLLHLR